MMSHGKLARAALFAIAVAVVPSTAFADYEAKGTVVMDGERLKGQVSVGNASISVERERLLRRDKGMTFALKDVESIRYESGLFGGAIYIKTKEGKDVTIEDLGARHVKAIKELLKDKI
jgi:hypothetical protein